MTDTEKCLTACCAAAPSGKKYADFPALKDADAFYELAFSQGVANIVYYALKDAKGLPPSLSERLSDAHDKAVYRDLLREEEEKRVFAAFDKADISYLPLKGSVMRLYYPSPDMRVMGDTDMMIEKYARKDARRVMKSCGYNFSQSHSGHDIYENGSGNVFELHYRPEDKSLFHQKLMERAIPVGSSGARLSLSHSDFYIYMISHLARHIRTTGAGLRFFTDVKVFLSRSGDKPNWEYVGNTLADMGLSDFEKAVKVAIATLFYAVPPSEQAKELTDYIFSGGVFGSSKNLAANKRGDKGRFAYFMSCVFPSFGAMKKRYPLLKYLPVLLPLFWPLRWISLLFRGKKPAERFAAGAALSREQLKKNKRLLSHLGLDNTKNGKLRMTKGDTVAAFLTIAMLAFAIVIIGFAFFSRKNPRRPTAFQGGESRQCTRVGSEVSLPVSPSDDSAQADVSGAVPDFSGEENSFAVPVQSFDTIPYRNGVYKGYIANGLPNGAGELKLPNGESYIGSFADGSFNGRGLYRYADGKVYDGMWFEGEIFGYGTLTFPDESYIYANFVDGKPQGECTFQNAAGDIYEGELKDGKRSGKGRFVWAGGDVYEGNYVDGEREGRGKYTDVNGDSYDGEWIASVPNGEGVMVKNGTSYAGVFIQGELEGKGVSTAKNGDKYEGRFSGGKYSDEEGVYTYADGGKYEGAFENNLFNGKGKFTYPDGDCVQGTFVDGLLQGKALYRYKSTGITRYIIYKNGKPA